MNGMSITLSRLSATPGPRDRKAATAVKKRTLTSLHNARTQWLVDAHAQVDAAVASLRLGLRHPVRRGR